MTYSVRPATRDDLAQITDIYNHYVTETTATFDLHPFRPADREQWFSQFEGRQPHLLLVAEFEGQILGYASSTRFRSKPAYDRTVEVTVYLRSGHTAEGLGSALYQALFEQLSKYQVHRYIAVITLPNEPSLALHEKFGFRQIGTLSEVGFKFDRYWDTAWLEKLS